MHALTAEAVSPTELPDRAERTERLLDELSRTKGDDARERLVEEIVEINMCVADSIAARYRGRGVPHEDLQQVAYMALVRTVRNYSAEKGPNLLSYAVPTIRGEIRRYFRDQGWTVRPPRRVQELQWRISAVSSALSTRLGRPPTAEELAEELEEDIEDIEEAQAAKGCFTPASLDMPVGDDPSATVGDLLSEQDGQDDGHEAAEARVVLAPVVRRLGSRDRRILQLRFFQGCTQQEIADDIGVTQMQVSRLLSRIFHDLREEIKELN